MNRVAVPSWILAVICVGLGLSLLAVAFLLGRESSQGARTSANHAASPAPVAPGVAVAPSASQEGVPSQPPVPAAPAATAPVTTAVSVDSTPTTPGLPPPVYASPSSDSVQGRTSVIVTQKSAAPSAPVNEAERAAVVAYFASVDNLQPGSFSGSPDEIVNAAATGDMSGIDKLIAQARAGESAARAITPPAPCREVHQESVKLLGEGVEMLVALRGALAQGDVTQLQSFTARATSVKTRAEDLERRQQAIRTAYGVPAAPRSGKS